MTPIHHVLFVSPQDFSMMTSMTYSWVVHRCKEGRIPCVKQGKYWRIKKDEALQAFQRGDL